MRLHTISIYSLGLALTLALPGSCLGQANSPQPFPQQAPYGVGNPASPSPDTQDTEMERRAMHKMAERQNKQREADLKRDTDQLLKLATQLKEYVDKTNENILSVQVINKADEIEKLAHSVKEKMKGP